MKISPFAANFTIGPSRYHNSYYYLHLIRLDACDGVLFGSCTLCLTEMIHSTDWLRSRSSNERTPGYLYKQFTFGFLFWPVSHALLFVLSYLLFVMVSTGTRGRSHPGPGHTHPSDLARNEIDLMVIGLFGTVIINVFDSPRSLLENGSEMIISRREHNENSWCTFKWKGCHTRGVMKA
jgi:hypothetical protein